MNFEFELLSRIILLLLLIYTESKFPTISDVPVTMVFLCAKETAIPFVEQSCVWPYICIHEMYCLLLCILCA